MTRRQQISYAIAFGALTHTVFLISVLFMVVALYEGLRAGFGSFHGWKACVANALLIAQFPVLHSFLLTRPGKKVLAFFAPQSLGRDLAPTAFALIASLQLLATFGLWSPSGITIYDASGPWLWFFRALFVASWIFLLKALTDAGVAIQTGFIGWSSVVRGKKLDFGDFPTHGLFKVCRHPVYIGFALILWTAPVHTLDGLLLAAIWTLYCVTGPLLKEKRYRLWHGERYARYAEAVPYMMPSLNRSGAGGSAQSIVVDRQS